MKNESVFWIIFIFIFNVGCKPADNQIRVYFDPSGATYLDKIPLIIKIDDQTILDTVVENGHVNKSSLMISFNSSQNDGALSAEINGKQKFIQQLSEISLKCTDIFLGYDDHLLIFKEVKKIEIEREDKHIPSDFKQLFDSIKASSGNKYHQIIFNVKEGKCNRY
jgi:hypothetical protein